MDLVRTLARTRRGRLLHPAGRSFDGALEITGTPGRHWGARVLDRPAVHRTTVRISKATPTPPGWPDVRGLALRIAADEPFDLLMSTTAAAPALRHVPLPGRSFAARYGSLLSYRSARGRVLLGAVPDATSAPAGRTLDDVVAAARSGLRFVLVAATPAGRWREVGRLAVDAPLPGHVDAELAFDPFRRHPDDLRTVGLIQRVRGAAYRASQRGRAEADRPA